MLPDRVSNPGPLTYELGALPIALRGPATTCRIVTKLYYSTAHRDRISIANRVFISIFCMLVALQTPSFQNSLICIN